MTDNQIIRNKNRLSQNDCVMGLFGMAPMIGVLIGMALIWDGFKKKKDKLKIVGLINIAFSFAFLYLGLPIINKSNIFLKTKTENTRRDLNEVVKDLEYYKKTYGTYPDNLDQLRKQSQYFSDFESFRDVEIGKETKPPRFYYKKLYRDYILKSYGPDKILHTKDDIFPPLKIDTAYNRR